MRMKTTVIGNYPKIPNLPMEPRLRIAIREFQLGNVDEDGLKKVEDEVTLEVIEEQELAGLDIITDGQIRWDDEITYIAKPLGLELNGLVRFFDNNVYYRQPVAEKKPEWQGKILVSDYLFLKQHSEVGVKAVLTGPYTVAKSSRQNYTNFEKFVHDVTDGIREEITALRNSGCDLIQINEPAIVQDRNKNEYSIFKRAIEELCTGGKTALYTYFGDASGIYPELLNLPVDIIGLDLVSTDGNFEEIKEYGCKNLGSGIVDARNTKIESREYLNSALSRIIDRVDGEIYVSPNAGLDFLPREVAYEKLRNMVNWAKDIKSIY